MATKPENKLALTLDEELGIISKEEAEAKTSVGEVPETVTVINVSTRTIFLESGRIDPQAQGIATRSEFQNLDGYIERVG